MRTILLLCLALTMLMGACTFSEVPKPEAVPEVQLEQPVPPEPKEKAEPEPVIEPQPEIVWPAAPQKSETLVFVDGVQLDSFTDELLLLVQPEAFSDVVGLQVQTAGTEEEPVCKILYEEQILSFSAGPEAVYDGEQWYVPLEALCELCSLRMFSDEEKGNYYYSSYPDPKAAGLPQGIKIPVLMYHAVSDDTWGMSSLFVSPSELEKQLQLIQEKGYTPIFFEELPYAAQYEKPIILTFDDGYDDNYTELYPILQKYQVKATIFVIAERMGTPHKMTAEQVLELSKSGLVSIQSHTMEHPLLSSVDAVEQEYQMSRSRLKLLRLTGKLPTVLSYPEGAYNQTTLEIVPKYYDFAVRMDKGVCYRTGDDPYTIFRYFVNRNTPLNTFEDMLQGE